MIKKDNPGCKCGCNDFRKCMTTVVITFFDVTGGQYFVNGTPTGAPGLLNYTVTGSTKDGKPISLSGTTTVGSKPWTAGFNFPGTTLPDGNYSLHIFSSQVCNGQRRFDCSYPITVKCPKTTITGSCQAAFDLVGFTGSFGHDGCNPCSTSDMGIDADVPGTICSSSPISCFGGNCSVSYLCAVTTYPATATFTGGQEKFTTETYSVSVNVDGSRSYSPVPITNILHSLEMPIQICSACLPDAYALPDGTVSISGRYNGSGSPGSGCETATNDGGLGNVGKMSVTNDLSATSATITVSHDKFNDATRTIPAPPLYYTYRHACFAGPNPTGGNTGNPIYGQYACAGCPLPLNWVLHATIFGENVTLTCTQQQYPGIPTEGLDPLGAGGFWGWGGYFSKSIPSIICNPTSFDKHMGTGSVEFYAIYGGGSKINVSCRGGQEAPSQCPDVGMGAIAYSSGYSGGTSGSACEPFMAFRNGTWTYGLKTTDGEFGPFTYELDFSISG